MITTTTTIMRTIMRTIVRTITISAANTTKIVSTM